MTKMPHDDLRRINRRRFLELVFGGSAAVAIGAVVNHYYDFRVAIWGKKGYLNLGDESRDTTQADVDALYEKLFDGISKEKAIAKENGRDFMILMGENHVNRDSLLAGLLITDIAAKLGIKTFVTEGLEASYEGLSTREHFPAKYSFPQAIRTNDAIRHFSESFHLHEQLAPEKKDPEKQHAGQTEFAMHLGMKVIGADPLNPTYKKNKGEKISYEEREEEMRKALAAVKGDRLARYGGHHLPFLFDTLKDQLHILPINTSNSICYLKDDREKRQRDEFPSVVIEGREVDEAKAFEFLLIASLKHDLRKQNMGEKQQEEVIKTARKTIYKEAPKLMGPMPDELLK